MKYWWGYLVAGIVAACSWGLAKFSETHGALVDMIYPYVTRIVQSYLAGWSSGVEFCVWQVLVLVLLVLTLASIVLMIVLKWNAIQWGGWVLAVLCAVNFANTAAYGLNHYSSTLAVDMQLENAEYRYTIGELEAAAIFYRDRANELADQVRRDEKGDVAIQEIDQLSQLAGEGFDVLTYERFQPVFAGSRLPIKELDWAKAFTKRGVTGITVPLTGESAINPQTPAVMQPYVVCREMAKRMCIATEQDANFAAFLACDANSAAEFRYAAYLMAYRYCHAVLASVAGASQQLNMQSLENGVNANMQHDLDACEKFFNGHEKIDESVCDLLVVWHIQEYVLPLLQEEEEEPFDPFDESVVDLTGLV